MSKPACCCLCPTRTPIEVITSKKTTDDKVAKSPKKPAVQEAVRGLSPAQTIGSLTILKQNSDKPNPPPLHKAQVKLNDGRSSARNDRGLQSPALSKVEEEALHEDSMQRKAEDEGNLLSATITNVINTAATTNASNSTSHHAPSPLVMNASGVAISLLDMVAPYPAANVQAHHSTNKNLGLPSAIVAASPHTRNSSASVVVASPTVQYTPTATQFNAAGASQSPSPNHTTFFFSEHSLSHSQASHDRASSRQNTRTRVSPRDDHSAAGAGAGDGKLTDITKQKFA